MDLRFIYLPCSKSKFTTVSMEVSNSLVSWFRTYLGDEKNILIYRGEIIHLLSTSRTSQ